jgi:hypothetical protein
MTLRHCTLIGALILTLVGCERGSNPEPPFPQPLGEEGLIAQARTEADLGILGDQTQYRPPEGVIAQASNSAIDGARETMSSLIDAVMAVDAVTLVGLVVPESLGPLQDDDAKEALTTSARKLQVLLEAIKNRLDEPELAEAKLVWDAVSGVLRPERIKELFRYEELDPDNVKVDVDPPRVDALFGDLETALTEALPDQPMVAAQIGAARAGFDQARQAALRAQAQEQAADADDPFGDTDNNDPNADGGAAAGTGSDDSLIITQIDGQWLLNPPQDADAGGEQAKREFMQAMQIGQRGLDILIEFVESTPAATFADEAAMQQAVLFNLMPKFAELQADMAAGDFGDSGFGETEDPFGQSEDDPFADDSKSGDDDPFADDGSADADDDDPFADDGSADSDDDDPFVDDAEDSDDDSSDDDDPFAE